MNVDELTIRQARDTAPRDLVPLARQIEEFLTGVPPLLDRELAETREFVAQMDLRAQREKSAAARAVETLADAEHVFD